MSGWSELRAELDAWAAAGRRATFWWRDDDAEGPGARLDRLLALAGRAAAPLALAVVPAGAGRPLAEALAGRVPVLTHGLAHRNLAPDGERKAEFGPHRPVFEMLADVAAGWNRLHLLFGAAALPVFVPPWNRIAPDLVPRLANAGIAGLSALGPRPSAAPAPGLLQANCHLDPLDWRRGGVFRGEAAVLGVLTGHLRARRLGRADAAEPSGLMTHHLVQDEATWNFVERLLDETHSHGAADWLSPREIFNLAP